MNLSDNLKRIRKEHNLSQEELAEKLGVSRQSVSKWESGTAFPEMDKVIQICKIFNVNMDDLMNQDIKAINNTREAKSNINKVIDDFFKNAVKLINMFINMKLSSKIKFLFEEAIIILILVCLFFFIGSLGEMVVYNIFDFLPHIVYRYIYGILFAAYLVFALLVASVIFLKLLKIRYLDYIELDYTPEVEEDKKEEKEVKEEDKKEKIEFKNNQPKIIIRDPKNESVFIKGLLTMIKFVLKCFALVFAVPLICSLVGFIICLVLSFAFIGTGFTFLGALLGVIGLILANVVILNIFYDFIFNHKSNKNVLAMSFLVAIILGGIGSGVFMLGLKDFDLVSPEDKNLLNATTYNLPLKDNIAFYISDVNYIESDNNDVKIEILGDKYIDYELKETDRYLYVEYDAKYNVMNIVREQIKFINNKKISNIDNYFINVYTTKANIEKIKTNSENLHTRD